MSTYASNRLNGAGGGGGGGGSGVVTVDLYDPIDTSVTTGPATISPFVVDGVTVTTGTTVLFSNLSTGNNEVYVATVSGSTISWAVVNAFNGSPTPTPGSLVVITQGNSFANQIGEFNGTTWQFNYYVRYFNGTNYYEQSSLYTATLADATTDGTVFAIAYAGSQNILVDYSVIRSGIKEAGVITLTTNGSVVGISVDGSSTGATGVSFSAVISGANIVLQYTTTSTGSAGTMQYFMFRWSDTAGGPGGPPSYSGSAPLPASGSNGNIQFNNAGTLGASSNFNIDSVNNILYLGSKQILILQTASILDNQSTPVTIVSMPSTYNYINFEYSIVRGAYVRSGHITIATDGVLSGHEEDYADSGDVGIAFTVSLSGGNINLNYTSTSTGSGGTFKYAITRW